MTKQNELLCKLGDVVYSLHCYGFRDWKMTEGKIVKIIHELGCEDKVIEERKERNNEVFRYFVDMQNLNKTVFLTKDKAEAKLKELKNGK